MNSLDFLLSSKILEKARHIILGSEKELTVISPDFDYDFASLLLDRASRGVHTTVITGSPDWASWFENKKRSYGSDEISQLSKETEKCKREYERLKKMRVITPSILIPVGVVIWLLLYLLGKIDLTISILPILLLSGTSGYVVWKAQKRLSELNSTIAVQQQSLQERLQETTNVRSEIEKNLVSILNRRVNFTLVYNGDEGFVTSLPLSGEIKEEQISFYEDIKKDKVDYIISLLSKSS